MNKRYLISCLFLTLGLLAWAEPIGKESAMRIAQDYLRAKGKKVGQEPYRAPRKVKGQMSKDATAYYVFNAQEKGFVIVSGDDRTEAILGYSADGHFDEATMPEHVKSWLQHYADQIEVLDDGMVRSPRKALTIHPAISPMLRTKWNQGSPYNLKCPKYNGSNMPVGCVATAVAQVMKYHEWPKAQMKEGLEAYRSDMSGVKTDLEALPAITFDWANMMASYSETSSDAQKNEAVATLMRYCGQACYMNYGPQGSGTNYYPEQLIKKFDYAKGARREFSRSYTIKAWDEMIYNELFSGRPVLYDGHSTGGGHAFVVDGYKDGLYHVNWGWGGNYDGYFRLTILEPGGGGIGASTTSDGYSCNQGAVIGLQPSSSGDISYNVRMTGQQLSLKEDNGATKMYSLFYNLTGTTRNFDIAMAKLNADLSISSIVFQYSNIEVKNQNGYGMKNEAEDRYGIADGQTGYFVYVCRETGTTEWQRIFKENACFAITAKMVNGKKEYTYKVLPVVDLDVKIVGRSEFNWKNAPQSTKLSFENKADEFKDNLYLMVKTPSGKEEMVALTGLALEAGQKETISFSFEPQEVGTYQAYLVSENDDIIAAYTTESLETPIKYVSLSYDKPGGKLTVTLKNENPIGKDYAAAILAFFYKLDSKTNKYVYDNKWLYAYPSTSVWLSNGSTKTVNINMNTNGQYVLNGSYRIYFQYAYDFKSTSTIDYLDFEAVDVVVDANGTITDSTTGIETPETTADNGVYYTILGERMTVKPTKKGLYIQNGKKVILK